MDTAKPINKKCDTAEHRYTECMSVIKLLNPIKFIARLDAMTLKGCDLTKDDDPIKNICIIKEF